MEPWQEIHVNRNIMHLIKYTHCNPILLSMLVQNRVLGDSDIVDLEAKQHHRFDQSRLLLEILKGRTESYDVLKDALWETNQTGAFKILDVDPNILYPNLKSSGPINFNNSEILGKGSNSTVVYNGTFMQTNVAIKSVETSDKIGVQHVLKEIELLKKLSGHENILRYFHTEITETHILVALEKCNATLQEFVEREMQSTDVLSLLQNISKGVKHLHLNSIFHGDLKPSNILLVIHNGSITPKIADFGLSRKLDYGRDSITVCSSVGLGTFGWMAPELIDGTSDSKKTMASDIFSLGCIYYYVLTKGMHPFGDNLWIRMANIQSDKPEVAPEKLQVDEHMKFGTAQLIRLMVANAPKSRPNIDEVLEFNFSQNETTQGTSALADELNQVSLQETTAVVLSADEMNSFPAPQHVSQQLVLQPETLEANVPQVKKKKQPPGRIFKREVTRILKQAQDFVDKT